MWKGSIQFGGLEVPVKLYAGLEDRGVHFRLLHQKDRAPVKQAMVNIKTGKEVESKEVQKGAPIAKGRFVLLTAEELASIDPPESRAIEVERFVPPRALDHALYDRPYWLGPDGDDSPYWALVEALEHEDKEGIVHWTMRKRAYVGALRVNGEHLMLVTLRRAGEVIEPSEIDAPKGRAPDAQELAMAKQLVEMLKGKFEATEFHDEYRERILDLVRRKAEGEDIELPKPKEKPEAANLARALEQSLAAMGGAKPAKKKTARKTKARAA
ncbi:MAG TPA: Ku protein [Terriglobales bacterium]|nr:Ku protein [Terriglobales bacterium]